MTYKNLITRFLNYKFNLVERENENGKYYTLISSQGHLIIFSDTYNDSILNSSILIDPCGKLENWHDALYIGKYPENQTHWDEIITTIQNFSDLSFISSGLKLKEVNEPSTTTTTFKAKPVLYASGPSPKNIRPLRPKHLARNFRGKSKKTRNPNTKFS